jgi:hypothetical protein
MKQIEEKLDSFFGPYMQISETNKLLHGELASRQASPPGGHFRLLRLLLTSDWRKTVSKTDETLIDEIIRHDKVLDELIRTKAGLVDDAVRRYLERASLHFRIISLAHEGALRHDASFPDHLYVYPRQLDEVMQRQVARLRERSALLRQNPNLPHSALAPLHLSEPHLQLTEWPKRLE